MNFSFSSVRILKPDVPPKRTRIHWGALAPWLRLGYFPARHFVAVGNPVTQQSPAAKRKTFWRHRS
jgi:hypothetical protein